MRIVKNIRKSLLLGLAFVVMVSWGSTLHSSEAYAASALPANQPIEPIYEDATKIDFDDSDDGVSGAIPIGFSFDFYGTKNEQVYANTNGLLMFNNPTDDYGTPESLEELPLESPNHYITAFFADLSLEPDGTVLYKTIGEAPNRKFVLQYTNMRFCCNSNMNPFGTFQVILYESTNVIQLQYPNLMAIHLPYDPERLANEPFGSNALIGIQESDIGDYVTYSLREKSLTAKQAIQFIPDDQGSYTMIRHAQYEPILLNNELFPGYTQLLGPADGTFAPLSPTFQWETAANAVSYEFIYSTDSEFINWDSITDIEENNLDMKEFEIELEDGATYYWKVAARNDDGYTTYSNTYRFVASSIEPATVETDLEVSQINSMSAIAGGTVTSDGGGEVTERGIVYSTHPNPTVIDGKSLAELDGADAFSVHLTGLQSATIYYARAYVINEIGVSYGNEVDFRTLSSSASLKTLTLSNVTLDQTVSENVYAYTGNVPNSLSSITISATVSDSTYGTVTASVYNSANILVAGPISLANGETSSELPLNVGSNRIELFVIAQDGTGTKYTATITRAAHDNGSVDNGNNGGGSSNSSEPVISTNGSLTLPVGRAGEVRLDNELVITIPASASSKELKLSIEKVLNSQNLLSKNELLASSIYEVLKNFPENFNKPVTLTFAFDSAKLNSNQTVAIFYFDEVKKEWVKVNGGKINGSHIAVEVDHFTKYAVLVVDQATGLPVTDSSNFSDTTGHWAEAQIKQAVSKGIVKGYSDGTFKPNATVTRAEFAVMLMNALKPADNDTKLSFTDHIAEWAQKAIAQASEAKIVNGYEDGSFRPAASISRSELAVMMARAAKADTTAATVTNFADDSQIPVWAKGSVAAVKELGIISGRSGNLFVPNDTATRAEAVTIIINLLQLKK
ncbi:S-layer homology domain-containing protein [Paenibacillus sp. TAF43_2]|uniref:S-layer homology domain-containing protein n=1 Tax=Paenibacillus sp. TAF43_2 TaxID=3233069 RepID=UPI003F96D888